MVPARQLKGLIASNFSWQYQTEKAYNFELEAEKMQLCRADHHRMNFELFSIP